MLCPTLSARRQVPFIELLLPSRCVSAGFVSGGLQLTANATTGKNWMPRRLLDGALAKVDTGSGEIAALVCCVPIVVPYPLAKAVPSLLHPEKCAQSTQRSQGGKPPNCLVTKDIGDFFRISQGGEMRAGRMISTLGPSFVERAECTVKVLFSMQLARFLGCSPAR